jgi:predicted nucleotidyltransferase
VIPLRWKEALIEWAQRNPDVAELWVYGSRARGNHREDSDLDVAIVPAGDERRDGLAIWMFGKQAWKREFEASIPVAVHLEYADFRDRDGLVVSELREYGVQTFERARGVQWQYRTI